MKKLGWLTLFCNSLEVAGEWRDHRFQDADRAVQTEHGESAAVHRLETIASGDSGNDLGMIQASKAGFLFRSTDKIKADHPELPAYEKYEDLLAAIKNAMK